MKKRIFAAAIAASLVILLAACAPQSGSNSDTATQTPSESTLQTEAVTEPVSQEDSARDAFQRALKTIHDELSWPALPDEDGISLASPGTIEDEQFAVTDVDGDGAEELLVSIFNTYTAGMQEVIYGLDPQTGNVRVEAQNYVGITHYPGLLKVDASHNHGYAGDVLWPYTVMVYDPESDSYRDAYIVDAWSKAIADYDPYREMPYPENIDTEQDAYVYLITENGQQRILNRTDYEAWEAQVFAQKEPLTIPWQKITEENIAALRSDRP